SDLITATTGLENAANIRSANAAVIVAVGLSQPSYSPFLKTGLRLIETFSCTEISLFFIVIIRIFRISTDD
ncbi:FUSC family protein, partial [Francisella tularensis subsp. holarctica]|nr:FUSC family protein [Francisella tularensis subsp. holarctica]